MNTHLNTDLQQIEGLLEKVKAQSLSYLHNLKNRPTTVQHVPVINNKLPAEGLGADNTLLQFNKRFEKLMVASSGPRYWGFVIGGSTPASIAGDWLATVYDQNPQAMQGQGDVSAVIEKETIYLLLDLFELPQDFTGGFVTGATLANFTGLAVARQWIGRQYGKDFAKAGIAPADIKTFTATPHSSALKSLSMLGAGSSNFESIKTLTGNREAIDVDDLINKIEQLDNKPFILISSAGTVNTVDFDDFEAIATLKKKYNFWWHVDAAFGAFAACSPAHKYLLNGWQHADSIAIDCHKWLNVPYENAFFLIKEKHSILQVETFQNSTAPYLGDPRENFNYLNFLPENSRRLRALPVWFSLTAYGKDGYLAIVENCIEMANLFAVYIEQQTGLELLAPVRLNTVCFTLKGKGKENQVQPFLEKINSSGKVFMTPTVYKGRKAIRAAFVNWRTTAHDVYTAGDVITKVLQQIKNTVTI